MAFLFKRPHSKNWHAGFIDKYGKRRNASTGVSSKKEAQKIANAYEEAAQKQRTSRQVRDVITSLHKEITGEDLTSQSFKEFSDAWLLAKEPEVSKATLIFYKNALAKFTLWAKKPTRTSRQSPRKKSPVFGIKKPEPFPPRPLTTI